VPLARVERAPAKINLTLHVIARRADGYHEIESLVAFAGLADQLTFTPGRKLALAVSGPTAARCGELADNLVLKAARGLAERVDRLKLGRFHLSKRLPVAAGLGGGSSDAAAALRLLARVNRLALHDPRLMAAARAAGADVPVCLDPRSRVMRGIGDVLSPPIELPRIPVILVNPGVMVATKDVFRKLRLRRPASIIMQRAQRTGRSLSLLGRDDKGDANLSIAWACRIPGLAAGLADLANDLEKPAIRLQPVIAEVLAALSAMPGCLLARMSGSGATCFALFETPRAASLAARKLRAQHPAWWVRATVLGG
jgi:4-diphosphocytidyl-2-C-methyl-D-erythritol kinase